MELIVFYAYTSICRYLALKWTPSIRCSSPTIRATNTSRVKYSTILNSVITTSGINSEYVRNIISLFGSVVFILTDDLITGLEQNSLLDVYSHLLTGYIGQDAFLRKVVDTVKKLRAANPDLIYGTSWDLKLFGTISQSLVLFERTVCDPVMGDDGQMYVPANLMPIYRDEIIPLSDICTPNQFEVELLTGQKIHSTDDAWQAMRWFHDRGVGTVALSSTDLGAEGELLAFVSHRQCNSAQLLRWTLSIPRQGGGISFTGTGDLFASLFLAHSALEAHCVKTAFERTVATLQAVIANTVARMPVGLTDVQSQHRELKIVQSKCDIESPTVRLEAIAV